MYKACIFVFLTVKLVFVIVSVAGGKLNYFRQPPNTNNVWSTYGVLIPLVLIILGWTPFYLKL